MYHALFELFNKIFRSMLRLRVLFRGKTPYMLYILRKERPISGKVNHTKHLVHLILHLLFLFSLHQSKLLF